ncbi:hypothetical protein Dvina_32325 [Dactylosporangium vinaceum]|uniref:Uncharacterized protein n=1 Tax=Dactylosporangium vinaceum TaxID=53362 RepID=A0ABV5MAG6_9ACTN|nr:hypothetical protein [Dactylosporangium vinaceum]UAB92978.1 hypothetical protein Dvina_32325 [Dactylosporangium vinaceum]
MIAPATGPALAPVRAAIRQAARAEAARRLRSADARAAATLAGARAGAQLALRDARAAGTAEARALGADDLAGWQLEARTIVLAARRERYDEVRRQALDRLRRAGLEPTLRARIVGVLGTDADIEPVPAGGLVGRAGERTVDCSLTALVDHAMSKVAGRIEEAWT